MRRRQAIRLGPICGGFVAREKAGRVAVAAEYACFVVVLWKGSRYGHSPYCCQQSSAPPPMRHGSCHKTTTKHACPAASASLISSHATKPPQTSSSAGLVPAHWHSESTNCRPKHVTLLPLSIKQWKELKQEVAKISLQTVFSPERLRVSPQHFPRAETLCH